MTSPDDDSRRKARQNGLRRGDKPEPVSRVFGFKHHDGVWPFTLLVSDE